MKNIIVLFSLIIVLTLGCKKAKCISEIKNDISNDEGYFHTGKSFSCGISSCNTDYKIEFSKEGYNTKVINENFYSSSEAEFLNADKKDTLIIKLDKI